MVERIRLFHLNWESKFLNISNKPKYSFFIDNDDHMMEFSKELIKSIELFLESLN